MQQTGVGIQSAVTACICGKPRMFSRKTNCIHWRNTRRQSARWSRKPALEPEVLQSEPTASWGGQLDPTFSWGVHLSAARHHNRRSSVCRLSTVLAARVARWGLSWRENLYIENCKKVPESCLGRKFRQTYGQDVTIVQKSKKIRDQTSDRQKMFLFFRSP